MKQNESTAAIRVDVYLVAYGIQADLFTNGVKAATKCRAFAGESPIEVLASDLVRRLGAVIDDFCGEF